MPEDLDGVRLPVEVEADPQSLKAIVQAAKDAEAAVKKLTAATKDLNTEQAAGRTAKRAEATAAAAAKPPKTADEREEQYASQRQRAQERRESNYRASTEEERFRQYSQQRQRAMERVDFERRIAQPMRTTFGQQLAGTMSTLASPSAIGTLAGGNAQPYVGALATALMRAVTIPGAAGGAGSAAGGGALGGLGDVLGGAASTALGLAGGLAGGYLFYNNFTAESEANRRTLGANVGGLSNSRQLYHDLLGAGTRFQQYPNATLAVTQALGLAGVQGNEINSNVQNTLALHAYSGRKPEDLAGLTAAMSVGGRQSSTDIGRSFAELIKQADGSKISLDAMIDSLKVLETTTGGLGLDYKAVAQIAAGSKALGPGVNLGAGMAALLGASGVQAISAAGMLGISTDQLLREQGALPGTKAQPGQLIGQLSQFVQRNFGRRLSSTQNLAAQEVLQNMGLYNLSGLSDAQKFSLVQSLGSGNLAAAMQAAGVRGEAPPNVRAFQQEGANIATRTTSAGEQLKIKAAAGAQILASPTGQNRAYTPPVGQGNPLGVVGNFFDQLSNSAFGTTFGPPSASKGNPFFNMLGQVGNAFWHGPGNQNQQISPVHITSDVNVHVTTDAGGKATVTGKTSRVDPNRSGKGSTTRQTTPTRTPKG